MVFQVLKSQNTEVPDLIISEDPSEWKINEVTRDYFAFRGLPRKKYDFEKSRKIYQTAPGEDKNIVQRFCTESMFQRKLSNGQFVNRDWVVYSEKTGNVFCGPCLLFINDCTQFGRKEGFSDWKNASTRMKEHEGGKEHMNCSLNFAIRGKELGKIDQDIACQVNAEITY